MKTQIILLLLIFSFVTSFSQIVLTMEDLPKAGDVVLRARIDSLDDLLLDPGEAGENISWEFSGLNLFGGSYFNAADSIMWINKNNAPENGSFPQADIAQKTNCYFYHNGQTHAITLECYNKYLVKDNEGLHLVGSSYPNIHQLDMSRNLFPLLNYGDTLIETSREVISVSADSIRVIRIIDTTIVDGWGVVHTPLYDLEALRYHTTEKVWDSLYINNIGEQVGYQPDNYYYKWYTNGIGSPVFQISKGVLEYQSQYKVTRFITDLKRVEIKDNPISESEIKVFPNPTKADILFEWKNEKEIESWTIDIYDINSNLVFKENNIQGTSFILKHNLLESGLYFYKITSKKSNITVGKIVIF